MTRIAIIYFGLNRGAATTIASIQKNIIACNSNGGYSLFTLASLNLVETLHNPRAGETGINLNPADAYLLNANLYLLARQSDETIAAPLAAARRQPDEYANNWASVRNLLHQLASLKRAWAAITSGLHGQFDYFLFLRPDLLYLDEILFAPLIEAFSGAGNIAVPPWHSYHGFNDRFAFADATAAKHYAERLDLVPEFCLRRPLHSESLLAFALQKAGCHVGLLPARAKRVRANGKVVEEDFTAFHQNLPARPAKISAASDLGQVTVANGLHNHDQTRQTAKMNTHAILYRAHDINDAVRREVKILKEQLPFCDIFVVGYAQHRPDDSNLPDGIEFILYDRAALEALEYPAKLQHVNWDSPMGHNDLPIFRFFRDRPGYEYYWIIEYDVRYTGHWNILFCDLMLSNADLLGTNVMDYDEAPHWPWWSKDQLPVSIIGMESRLKIFAPFVRLSRKLILEADSKYRTGWSGHYEMTLPTICKSFGLLIEDIGGNGRYTPRRRLLKHYLSNTNSWALFPGTFIFRPGFSDKEIGQLGADLMGKPMLWHPIKE